MKSAVIRGANAWPSASAQSQDDVRAEAMIELKIDTHYVLQAAKELGVTSDQVPFAMSLAMNRAVKATRLHLIGVTWPTSITERNKGFIRRALQTRFSDKQALRVEIYDALGRAHLAEHAEGGVKVPRGGNLAVPSRNIKRGTSGATPQRQKPRNLTRAFVKKSRIYQVVGRGKSRRLRVMYFLKPSVRIPKDVPFYEDFAREMLDALANHLPAAVAQAMNTRR